MSAERKPKWRDPAQELGDSRGGKDRDESCLSLVGAFP
jgi:hypothetical protein